MRTQRRNKKTVYLCMKYQDGKLTKYKKPIELKENIAVTNRTSDLLIMGMEYTKRLRIKSDSKTLIDDVWYRTDEVFHPGDRVYVFVKPPMTHDVMCSTADYEVEIKPNTTLNQTDIILRNISGTD